MTAMDDRSHNGHSPEACHEPPSGVQAQLIVTLCGRIGMAPHRAAQIFAPTRHKGVAQQVLAFCGRAGHLRAAQLALHIVDAADADGQSVLRLSKPICQIGTRQTYPAIVVVGEGELMASLPCSSVSKREISGFASSVLDRLSATRGES
jgi:hypothetical protein